jgi:hypothetical protein
MPLDTLAILLNVAFNFLLMGALFGVGAFGAIATISPLHSPVAPRWGFPALLAGVCGLLLAVLGAGVTNLFFGESPYNVVGFAAGYGVGILAGLDAGRWLADYYLRNVWPQRAGRAAPDRPAV